MCAADRKCKEGVDRAVGEFAPDGPRCDCSKAEQPCSRRDLNGDADETLPAGVFSDLSQLSDDLFVAGVCGPSQRAG